LKKNVQNPFAGLSPNLEQLKVTSDMRMGKNFGGEGRLFLFICYDIDKLQPKIIYTIHLSRH